MTGECGNLQLFGALPFVFHKTKEILEMSIEFVRWLIFYSNRRPYIFKYIYSLEVVDREINYKAWRIMG